jgi:riboflavin synthase
MGEFDTGTAVNIEVDLLARYIERMLGNDADRLSIDFLREHGYA